jgi:hypothetical protein
VQKGGETEHSSLIRSCKIQTEKTWKGDFLIRESFVCASNFHFVTHFPSSRLSISRREQRSRSLSWFGITCQNAMRRFIRDAMKNS